MKKDCQILLCFFALLSTAPITVIETELRWEQLAPEYKPGTEVSTTVEATYEKYGLCIHTAFKPTYICDVSALNSPVTPAVSYAGI